jgi:hypothetical protein
MYAIIFMLLLIGNYPMRGSLRSDSLFHTGVKKKPLLHIRDSFRSVNNVETVGMYAIAMLEKLSVICVEPITANGQ